MTRYAIWYGIMFDGVTVSETVAEEARQRGAVVVEVPEGTPLTLCALTALRARGVEVPS